MLRRTALLLLLSFVLTAADLTGTWHAAVESTLGSGTPVFTFKQVGKELTGDYSGALGTARVKGAVKGDAVEFAFDVEAGGETIRVKYQGTLAKGANRITGTIIFGSLGQGEFIATRR